jgi:hypothetical protein
MENDTAGDPMSLKKWSRKSIRNLSDLIREKNILICANTTAKILKELRYSLKSNRKTIAETQHPDRNQQFEIIAQMKDQFKKLNYPSISVDSKKKELVGNFKNAGRTWCVEPESVYTHDFRSCAVGLANPYGIYELLVNSGTVVVGTSYDTPEFAVECIVTWLNKFASENYADLSRLLILCDCGGSNSYRARAWKYGIFKRICQPFEIRVTVCHYPTGASKWNPVEHRLFSFISMNWAGVPLRNYDTILRYISSTKTKQGLRVNAFLNDKVYEKGIKISDQQMKEIKIEFYHTLPQWNYTIFN